MQIFPPRVRHWNMSIYNQKFSKVRCLKKSSVFSTDTFNHIIIQNSTSSFKIFLIKKQVITDFCRLLFKFKFAKICLLNISRTKKKNQQNQVQLMTQELSDKNIHAQVHIQRTNFSYCLSSDKWELPFVMTNQFCDSVNA